MRTFPRITIFFLVLFVICSSFFLMEMAAFSQDTKKKDYKVRITWQAVEGAGGYIVEMNNDRGVQVLNTETNSNFVVPRLPSGNYSIRITVLDKFHKPADSTPWTKIIVKKSESPVFEDISKSVFTTGEIATGIKITGDSFDEKISVSIDSSGGSIAVRNMRRISEEELVADFDLTGVPPGSYSLVLQNPDAKKTVVNGKVSVAGLNVGPLRIDHVSPSSVRLKSDTKNLRIFGPWFAKKSTVTIRAGEKVQTFDSEKESEGVISITISTKDLGTGEFDIAVKSEGQDAIKKSALVITDYPGLTGLGGITIGATYRANMYLSDWKTVLKNSYTVGGITAGVPFGSMPFVPWSIFTSHAGIDCSVDYITAKLTQRPNRWYGSYTAIPVTLNIYGSVTPTDLPLSLIFRAGGGVTFTSINLNKPSPGAGTSHSIDPLWQAGGGIRFIYSRSFFFEAGSMYVNTIYKSTPMKSIQGYFTAGILL